MSRSINWILTLSSTNEWSSKILNADDWIVSISEFSIRSSVNFLPLKGSKFRIHDRLMKIFGFVRFKLVVVSAPSAKDKSATSLKEALNDVVPKTSLCISSCQMFSTIKFISRSPSNDFSNITTFFRLLKLISGKLPQMPLREFFQSSTWAWLSFKISCEPCTFSELIRLLLAKKPFLITSLDFTPRVMLRALLKKGSFNPSSSVYS